MGPNGSVSVKPFREAGIMFYQQLPIDMDTRDLSTLRDQLPDVFEDMDPPENWDDYHIIPVGTKKEDNFEIDSLTEATRLEASIGLEVNLGSEVEDTNAAKSFDEFSGFGSEKVFPGSPQEWDEGKLPPTDTLAFYLPFHFYYPSIWGIYLTKEGISRLIRYLRAQSGLELGEGWKLSQKKAEVAARLFLYYHEAFHHNVESMATRLEVTHRKPLYRRGFRDLYQRTFLTSECGEEALANAYAYRKVVETFNRKGWKAGNVRSGLRQYIKGQPPGYNRGMEFVENDAFIERRNEFAKANFRESLPSLIKKDKDLWTLFTNAFSGICKMSNHTNYLVRKGSPLLESDDLHEHYIGYRDLKDKLDELVGLHFEREGKGSHEIYETDEGNRVTLYQTTGDFPKGTLNSILKEAGVDMSVHDFVRTKV